MIHRLVLSGLTNKKQIPLKMIRYKDWSEKAAIVQRRKTFTSKTTLKDSTAPYV